MNAENDLKMWLQRVADSPEQLRPVDVARLLDPADEPWGANILGMVRWLKSQRVSDKVAKAIDEAAARWADPMRIEQEINTRTNVVYAADGTVTDSHEIVTLDGLDTDYIMRQDHLGWRAVTKGEDMTDDRRSPSIFAELNRVAERISLERFAALRGEYDEPAPSTVQAQPAAQFPPLTLEREYNEKGTRDEAQGRTSIEFQQNGVPIGMWIDFEEEGRGKRAKLFAAAPDMLMMLRTILMRLDLEPKSAVFPCSAMREDIRRVIDAATK